MADPVLSDVDHGVEGWDLVINANNAKLEANWMRKTKGADFGQVSYIEHAAASSGALAGATYTFAGLIPAGCILLGITTRVTTLVTGATSIDIGDGTTADQFGDNTAVALNTTTGLANHKAGSVPKLYTAAGDVVLTANGANFTAGVVRATAHYIKLTPPTS